MSSLANWLPNYKQQYGDLTNPMPEENTLAEWFPFLAQNQRPGIAFNVPVVVGLEHGLTPSVAGDAFTLFGARDSVLKNAQVDGATLALQGNIPYDVTFRSRNGAHNGSGGGAFETAFQLKTTLMMQSMEFYRELSLLYGAGTGVAISCDIGVIGNTVVGTFGTGTGSLCPITQATWSAGIWNNMVGALVDVYQTDGQTVRLQLVTVNAVNPDYALNAGPSVTLFFSGSAVTPVAGDRIVPARWLGQTCIGVEAICKNTGLMFGINATTYPLWKVVQFNANGPLTRAKILAVMARLFPNGLDTGGRFFVNSLTFADLAEEADALQRFTSDSEVKRQGANKLEYKSPAGMVEVVLHKYMKQGEAMFFPRGIGRRVGSTDITFRGEGDDWFFLELSSQAGCQLRLLSNQAPFLRIPYRCAYISGITNSWSYASSSSQFFI